jgi:hypothetical protein
MHNTTKKEPKYLMYFADHGWANQQICLKNAYAMARILNRTLLLPPVLPHNGRGSTSLSWMVLTKDQGHYQPNTNPFAHLFYMYLERLPAKLYMPMGRVVDIKFSLPDIPTLDVREFHAHHFHENLTRSIIEIDNGYSHFNTTWVHKESQLEGKIVEVHTNFYGRKRTDVRTHRNLLGTLGNDPSDILVFLDTYFTPYHPSVRAAVPMWQPRLAPSIVQAVQGTVAKWPPYAAIHLRAGDGGFKSRVESTIRNSFQGVTKIIMQWLNANQERDRHQTIGLYVATDLENFHQHEVFAAAAANLTKAVYESHQVKMRVLSRKNVGNATKVLGGILYADIFLDMQLSACAPMGFQPSSRSTFSSLIATYRSSGSGC